MINVKMPKIKPVPFLGGLVLSLLLGISIGYGLGVMFSLIFKTLMHSLHEKGITVFDTLNHIFTHQLFINEGLMSGLCLGGWLCLPLWIQALGETRSKLAIPLSTLIFQVGGICAFIAFIGSLFGGIIPVIGPIVTEITEWISYGEILLASYYALTFRSYDLCKDLLKHDMTKLATISAIAGLITWDAYLPASLITCLLFTPTILLLVPQHAPQSSHRDTTHAQTPQ